MTSNRVSPTTPMLFSTELLNIASFGTVIPDMSLMTSIFRRPYLVDEIRWTYAWTAPGNNVMTAASSLRCRFYLGRIAMTGTRDGGGYVPIWNFGPALQYDRNVEDNLDTLYSTRVNIGHFRWRLPKPLYVPQGQVITPSIYRADNLGGSAKIGVAVVGRQLGDADLAMPEKIDVPFVSYYEPPLLDTSAYSSELDLVNPFLVPFHVQRAIGRQYSQTSNFRGEGVGAVVTGVPGTIANVVALDSWGNNLVRDVTDMGSVFDFITRTWTFNRILGPKERFNLNLLNVQVTSSTAFSQPQISLVGWREEFMSSPAKPKKQNVFTPVVPVRKGT